VVSRSEERLAPPQVPGAIAAQFDGALVATLLELRRAIHAEPELAFEETRTATRLEAALAPLRLASLERVAGTGIVARVAGRDRHAPAIAIRGDIDALPIAEETGLPYASRFSGLMHACGHDVHATWAVGAAMLLAASPASGDVVILLQPGEETGQGALRLIEAGALADVQAIFGAHVDMRFVVGEVVADEGPLAASSDEFSIEIVGRGAHAARPHEGADPIVGAATLVTTLQSIVSRRLDPGAAGVITVGRIHAGTASNIIPDRAVLAGTIRAVTPATRALLLEELRRVSAGVAEAHGLRADVGIVEGTPPLINTTSETRWARSAVAGVLGQDALVPLGRLNLAAEDFAHYLARVPGCFLRIGARLPEEAPIAAHSPRFSPAEASIFVGAAVLAECARVASAAASS
jgi:amidohydrolase